MFWALGSGKRREGVRNRVQGCHWFWSAREIELRGSTAGQPRWRRGGDRRAAWGAWQSGEGTSARARVARNAQARRVECLASRRWPGGGPARRAGGVRHWRRETEEQTGGRRKGLVHKFRKFQGPRCKSKITFNTVLRWKSAQHESCSTFQDLQLLCCAKIYLIKG